MQTAYTVATIIFGVAVSAAPLQAMRGHTVVAVALLSVSCFCLFIRQTLRPTILLREAQEAYENGTKRGREAADKV